MEEFYTVKEVAQALKVVEITILRYIRSGALNAVRLQGEYRITKKDFESYIESKKVNANKAPDKNKNKKSKSI